jgi:protein-S-isoprenylcysteine O-methyltransferase Ste14
MTGHDRHPRILVRPTPVFVAGFLAGVAIDRAVAWPMWSTADGWRLAAGIAAVALGTAWFTWGVQTPRRAKTGVMLHRPASRVVRDGPYRWSRNPQYLAYSTICLGAACLANSWWPLAALPLALAVVHIGVVLPEERYMWRTFGDDYAEYQRRVGRWISFGGDDSSEF